MRGTPQQIIDKYNQLARDAQLSGDRVAVENFQQHSEHYLRMLAEAMKEQAERQAQQQDRQRNNNNNNQNNQNNNQGGQPQPNAQPNPQNSNQNGGGDTQQPREDRKPPKAAAEGDAPSAEVIEVETGESALVETPEDKAPKPRRRKPKPAPEAVETSEQPDPPADAAE